MLVYYYTFSIGFYRPSKSNAELLPLQSVTNFDKKIWVSNYHPYQPYHFTTGSAGVELERSPLLVLTASSIKIKIGNMDYV